jgi:signal transduction histidine kinase
VKSAAIAVLVALGYYAGANVGLILRFPASTPSFVWPPNAILTAALLLVPPRRWWLCFLGALPAHLLAEFRMAWPTPLVLALFVTNCSEALIAAVGVRWLNDVPTRFDTLRRMAVFIVAAGLVAPFLSSFVDAAVVTLVREEAYWSVWQTRFFSNVLTELMLVPAIVMGVTAGPAWLRRAPGVRRFEAALLAAALVLVAEWVFGLVTTDPKIVGGPITPVVFLLPIILFATVRFGPGGASLCLLGTSLVAIWAAAHGRGPFSSLAAAETVLALQIFLIVLAIPILCLAAVVVEHRGARATLAERVEALHASEALKSAILGSLNTSVAVLDRDGRIVDINPNWARVAVERGAPVSAGLGVGDNFLETWRRAARAGMPKADEAAAGILGVLRGTRPGFALEYPCQEGATERWFAVSVVRLDGREGGAVVSCADVTQRKAAELDIERSRQELTHFMRVFMMGELTASLAHELNQPLTGILTNARAGLRFLDAVPPDLGELRAILSDIVDDDKRAGEVIQRLRDFLRKSEPQRESLDLNVLVNEVVRLVTSDAIIRNVGITLDLDEKPVLVSADRVQLQQVVLNLLLNAMEAMAGATGPERAIVVRTRNTEMQTVHVSVEDRGTGLRAGSYEMLFEPFFTTKPKGMGMGLAICRSIIEAHDGVIWAQDNPAGGATFHFALPAFAAAAT